MRWHVSRCTHMPLACWFGHYRACCYTPLPTTTAGAALGCLRLPRFWFPQVCTATYSFPYGTGDYHFLVSATSVCWFCHLDLLTAMTYCTVSRTSSFHLGLPLWDLRFGTTHLPLDTFLDTDSHSLLPTTTCTYVHFEFYGPHLPVPTGLPAACLHLSHVTTILQFLQEPLALHWDVSYAACRLFFLPVLGFLFYRVAGVSTVHLLLCLPYLPTHLHLPTTRIFRFYLYQAFHRFTWDTRLLFGLGSSSTAYTKTPLYLPHSGLSHCPLGLFFLPFHPTCILPTATCLPPPPLFVLHGSFWVSLDSGTRWDLACHTPSTCLHLPRCGNITTSCTRCHLSSFYLRYTYVHILFTFVWTCTTISPAFHRTTRSLDTTFYLPGTHHLPHTHTCHPTRFAPALLPFVLPPWRGWGRWCLLHTSPTISDTHQPLWVGDHSIAFTPAPFHATQFHTHGGWPLPALPPTHPHQILQTYHTVGQVIQPLRLSTFYHHTLQ